MGCYDTVRAECPGCGKENLVQTKAGDCELKTYSAKSVPLAIAHGLSDYRAPFLCASCGTAFRFLSPLSRVRLDVELCGDDDDGY